MSKMIKYYVCIFILISCLKTVTSIAIKGSKLTIYDPCGLGVISFASVQDYWNGKINLALYNNFTKIDFVEVIFENKVQINQVYSPPNKTVEFISEDFYKYILNFNNTDTPAWVMFSVLLLEYDDVKVPIVKKFSVNNKSICDDDVKINMNSEFKNIENTIEPDEQHLTCGRQSLPHSELFSIRTVSKPGDWPWHVAIFIKDLESNLDMYECGGNIISKTAILTAGHCVYKNGSIIDRSRVVVAAGINNYTDPHQIGRQFLIVQRVVLHPEYDDAKSTSDLAIIKVNRMKYTEFVQPICLWGTLYDKAQLVGVEAVVVGFGMNENNTYSKVLRAINTVIQNDATCIAYSPNLYTSLLNEFTFCVGYSPLSGMSPRNGDSGGGLILPIRHQGTRATWYLRRVLSKCGVVPGTKNCDPRFYVVYTDIGPHYSWIYHHSNLKY